jgi:hypothetical protein
VSLVSDPPPRRSQRLPLGTRAWMPASRAEVPRRSPPAHDALRPRTPAVKEMPAQLDEPHSNRSGMTAAAGKRAHGGMPPSTLPRRKAASIV